jgi:hypothetical protein
MGIISKEPLVKSADNNVYEMIKSEYVQQIDDLNTKFSDREKYKELEFEEGLFDVSNFGQFFIAACTD